MGPVPGAGTCSGTPSTSCRGGVAQGQLRRSVLGGACGISTTPCRCRRAAPPPAALSPAAAAAGAAAALATAATAAAAAAAAAAGSGPPEIDTTSAAAVAAAASSSGSGSGTIPWLPALALLAASWQAPNLAAAASDFLKPRKCKACWGSGFTLCGACGARGKRGGSFEGGPLVACPACEGRGRMRCAACGATGLANSWLWKPAEDPGWGARGE